MATGNVNGNLMSLQKELRQLKYPHSPDYASISQGSPTGFLLIIHYIMCDYSRPLTERILNNKIELAGKTDAKFMEGVYKVFRDIFNYTPRITNSQFFSKGFAEHKIIMTRDMVSMVRKIDKEMTRGKRAVRPKSGRGAAGNSACFDVAFKPLLNSTRACSPELEPPVRLACIPEPEPPVRVAGSPELEPPVSHIVASAEVSIVVGKTPVPTQMAIADPPTESPEYAVTRRTRRGVRGQDTGYNMAEGSPDLVSGPVVYDSHDLRTHPIIQDLLKRVRSLEEKLRSDNGKN